MAKRKRHRSALDRRVARELSVLKAYQRHYGSTTQREDAAAELGMDLGEFRELLDGARRHGFDVEARPDFEE
jgi:hypothetical protein